MIRITLRARDGRETVETDSRESRAVAYFRLNFCGPAVTDRGILHALNQTGSYSHSYRGGMARIERGRSWSAATLAAGAL